MAKHKCFISYKREDQSYKNEAQKLLHYAAIDKSLDESIDSNNPDYIMNAKHENYLADSTITIFFRKALCRISCVNSAEADPLIPAKLTPLEDGPNRLKNLLIDL